MTFGIMTDIRKSLIMKVSISILLRVVMLIVVAPLQGKVVLAFMFVSLASNIALSERQFYPKSMNKFEPKIETITVI